MSILIGEMVSTGPRRLLFIALVILVLERLTLGGEHDSLNDFPPLEKDSFMAKYQLCRKFSSLVIDDLCNKFRRQEDVVVTCLYCDFLTQKEQSTTSLVGALLKQVVARLESVPAEISDAFLEEKGNLGGRGLLLPDILKLLEMALASLRRVFICVDALDECLTGRLPELLRSLRSIVEASSGVRLFVTGRPHILGEIEKHFTQGVQTIPIKSAKEDIRRFISRRLEDDPISGAMDGDLKADIMDTVPKTASGMYVAEPRSPSGR